MFDIHCHILPGVDDGSGNTSDSVEMARLIQLNKGSLKGAFGSAAMVDTAHRIMRHRQADFVASDAHSQYRRTPFLAEIHEMISERYSNDYADQLLKVNPEKAIENSEISRD